MVVSMNIVEVEKNKYEDLAIFLESMRIDNVLPPVKRDRWLQRFFWWWDCNPYFSEDYPRGWILVDKNDSIRGFLGAIPVVFSCKDTQLIASAATTWAVEENYRKHSIALFSKYMKQSHVDMFIDTSPSEIAEKIIDKFGFIEDINDIFKLYIIPYDINDLFNVYVTRFNKKLYLLKKFSSAMKLFNKICKYIIKSNSTIDTNYKIIEADKNNISYIRKINNTHLSLQIDEFTLTWLLFCESSNRRCYVVLKNSKIVCHFFVRNLEVGYGGEKILLMEKIELYSLDKEILKVIISFTKNIMFNENFSAIFIVENRDEYTTLLDGLLLIRKKIRFPYYYKFLDDQKECPIIGSFLDPDRGVL